jgi:putative SOS response-associated peptidase YedK
MCGRFSLISSPEELRDEFGIEVDQADLTPRYNVAPQTAIAVIGLAADGSRRLGMLRWGLVPWWSKDAAMGQRLINARGETLAQKPAFKEAFERRRCLVLADGFYEWRRVAGRKIPMRIRSAEGRPIALAGVWERWRDAEGETLYSCAIVTTEATAALRPIHDRMPVILNREEREVWLDASRSQQELRALLRPYEGELEAYEVSSLVNSVKNDTAACVEPVTPSDSADPAPLSLLPQ